MPKYFTPEEVEGLHETLVEKLDQARHLAGFPFRITSGKRTADQNAAAAGVPDSSHLAGLAADLALPAEPTLREKMCWALGRAGFRRIFTYTRHVHADIDEGKAQDVMVYLGESH